MKRQEKVQEIHSMKKEGYKDSQIADCMDISRRTVRRLLAVNPALMCVDGTQTRRRHKMLDPYRKHIQELLEHGFQPSQILKKLKELFPGVPIKRTTLNDYCVKLREEIYDVIQIPQTETQDFSDESILMPHMDKIKSMLAENKLITQIFEIIRDEGYIGSYSLLQQACQKIKPKRYRMKKATQKVKRRDMVSAVWIGGGLSQQHMDFIKGQHPIFCEIERIFSEFRTAYSKKDIEAVQSWCENTITVRFLPSAPLLTELPPTPTLSIIP